MKHSLAVKQLLFHTGMMKAVRTFAPSGGVAILRYHAVVSPEDNFYASPSICISPDIFEYQVRYFSRTCNIISLDTVADCMENQTPFPKNSVVLTFDDGYQDNFKAYQILKKHNAFATFYIAAGCIDNQTPLWLFEVIYRINHTKTTALAIRTEDKHLDLPLENSPLRQAAIRATTALIKSHDLPAREQIMEQLRNQTRGVQDVAEKGAKVMLSWDQVREMTENGMSIGGHTMTHLNLPNADPGDAQAEIRDCKKLIEEQTGKPTHHFSYPNGGNYAYYNAAVKEMVIKAGYRTSTTSSNGVSFPATDRFELKRIRVTPHLAEIAYQADIEPLFRK